MSVLSVRSSTFVFAAGAAVAFLFVAMPAFAGDSAGALADRFAKGAPPAADTQRKADEREMLERARREAAPETALSPVQATPDQVAERKAELKRLAEKLRKAREAREAKKLDDQKSASALSPPPVRDPGMETKEFWKPEVAAAPPPPKADAFEPGSRSGLGMTTPAVTAIDGRVTVLLVMAPGHRGIRRFDHSADPILCTDAGCFVSAGTSAPARFMGHRRATGFRNTFGGRAGSCSQSLGCVFRGIDVGTGNGWLQPVDLKVMVHDRRLMQRAAADTTCAVTQGRLACARALVSADYALWIVPEAVANTAGPEALARAVAEGLPAPGERSAEGPVNPLR